MKKFIGVHAVLFALFNDENKIDFGLMESQLGHVLGAGVDGITVLGLATEVNKLSRSEQKEIVRHTVKCVNGRAALSVTVSGNSVDEQIEFSRFAEGEGADWLILQPPKDRPLSSHELMEFYLEVAGNIEGPFGVQNAPEYLPSFLSDEDILEMSKRADNFICIKAETSAEKLSKLINSLDNKLTILNGRGGLEMTDCLRAGCDGFIIAPDVVDHAGLVYKHWQNKKIDDAISAYKFALPAMVFSMQSIDHLLTYGKRMFGARVDIDIFDRPPFLAPTDFGNKSAREWAIELGPYGNIK